MHPLQTFAPAPAAVELAGAGCAVAGSSPAALALAGELALVLGMEPFEIEDDGRAAYHAAASMASNFLVALEAAAERVAGAAGLEDGGGARAARSTGPLAPSRTGSPSDPSGRSPARWPAGTSRRCARSAPPSRRPRPTFSRSSTRS